MSADAPSSPDAFRPHRPDAGRRRHPAGSRIACRARAAAGIAALAWVLAAQVSPVAAQSPPPEFVQTSGLLPVTIGGSTVRLETLTVRLAGPAKRRPVVLITHGKPSAPEDYATIHATGYRAIARDMARRGWFAVVVVRRGYGLSEGSVARPGTCQRGYDLVPAFTTEAQDLAATLTALAKSADADMSRILAIGVSAGGAAVTALAATSPPPGLKAVVNVSGGLRNTNCPFEDRLVHSFGVFGSAVRVPALWVYARNDSYFGPDLVERMRAAYANAGAPLRLVMTDPLGDEGHTLFMSSEGRTRWYAALDAFLTEQGLPTVGDAEVDAIMARGLEPAQRASVARYVAVPGEKALARPVGGGRLNWFLSGSDIAVARRNALDQCQKAAPRCEIVAENNRPVVLDAAAVETQAGPAAGQTPPRPTP